MIEVCSDAVVKLLTSISEISPRHLKEQTLPLLFTSLPDNAPPREAVAERARCWQTLSILKTLCHTSELFETLIIRLTTKLDLLCFPVVSDADTEPSAAYAHAILLTISQTIAAKADNEHTDISKYIETLVPRLFNLFIYGALASDGHPVVSTDIRLVQAAVQIVILIVQSVSSPCVLYFLFHDPHFPIDAKKSLPLHYFQHFSRVDLILLLMDNMNLLKMLFSCLSTYVMPQFSPAV